MDGASSELSPRELQVIRLLVAGESNKGIALKLGLSIRTVHSHVARAMAKTGTQTRTQLAVHALRQGIVSLHPDR